MSMATRFSPFARLAAVGQRAWPVGHWLLVLAVACVLLHGGHLPWLFTCFALGLLGVRIHQLRKGGRGFPRALRLGLAVLSIVFVLFQFGYFFGKEPGVALLIILLCLKFFEHSGPVRDVWVTLLLVLFLLLALLFYSQTPLTLVAVTLCFWLAMCALMQMQHPRLAAARVLRLTLRQLLGGLAVAVVLFFVVPRVEGPLWGLPADAAGRGQTGLSDTLTPGSISELIVNGGLVLRAEFDGSVPPAQWRYWRGPVLDTFDGRTWRSLPARELPAPAYRPAGERFRYRSTVQPTLHRWLLALDYPGDNVPRARYTDRYALVAEGSFTAPRTLNLEAWPQTPVGTDETAFQQQRALVLPAGGNPRTRRLAEQLREQAQGDPERIVQLATERFRTGELQYTLTPALLGNDAVDEFLFDTREGFCEHFASSFAYLMRAAGVPARIVVGYQGGQYDPSDNSLTVRQSEAHAWTEVWLPYRGWTRIDPTALAIPQRISEGIQSALPSAQLPYMLRPEQQWLRTLRDRWEALGRFWNERIIGFNPAQQRDLFEQLHLTPGRALLVALIALPILAFLISLAWRTWRGSGDVLDRLWHRYCARLARHGCPRHPWEGPLDYAQRAAAAFPRAAPAIIHIAQQYARYRYRGEAPSPAALRDLQQTLKQLKP